MMGGHHAISGAAAWLALTATAPALPLAGVGVAVTTGIYHQSPAVVILGALLAAGWALMADIDHHSATIAHSVPALGKLAATAVSAAAGGHRKGTHTLWALVAAAVVAWIASRLTWDTHTGFGAVSLGVVLLTAPAVAFATHSIKVIRFIDTWPRAWIAGIIVAAVAAVSIRDDFTWLIAAITVGYAVHLAGDMLTTGGIAPLYPLLPTPPAWWDRIPLVSRIWQPNGYVSIPILGDTGSLREWGLGAALTAYTLYVTFYELQALVAGL